LGTILRILETTGKGHIKWQDLIIKAASHGCNAA
jgi:hypothetical protein